MIRSRGFEARIIPSSDSMESPFMRSKLIHEQQGQRTFALVFDAGDEAMAGLKQFAEQNHLGAAQITGIGAFRDVTLGYFDWDEKEYQKIPVKEQVEVLSLIGDVAQ